MAMFYAGIGIAACLCLLMGLLLSALGVDERDPFTLVLGVALLIGAALVLVVH